MKIFFLKKFLPGLILILCIVILNSCIDPESERNEVIKTEYPVLADDIIERDFEGLWNFIDHENEHVRALAWKAIAKSETDDLDAFVDYAVQQDDSLAWYALSLHPLSGEHVDSIAYLFSEERIQSESVCEVFNKKGNLQSLNVLLDKPGLLYENKTCAKAVGGILARVSVDDVTRRTVFDLAFNANDERTWRNLLYGFYRSPLNRPSSQSVLNDNLSTYLEVRGDSFSVLMDEYIVRIAGKNGFKNVMKRRSDRELNQAIQLSNELARNVTLFESNELDHPYINRLLNHQADNVVIQTLQSLQGFESVPAKLLKMIEFEIAPITRDTEVFAEALTLLIQNNRDVDDYRSRLEYMDAQNEYLKHRILPLFRETETEEKYLDRIKTEISDGGIGGLRAVQALMNYFAENAEKSPGLIEKVASITRFALEEGDRSVVSTLNTLLQSPRFFSEDDYNWMYKHYKMFVDSGQWEKAQVLDDVLTNRFPDRFDPQEIPEKSFYQPNWDRLYEMGTQPFWVLETEKGTIEIRLDPLDAPFTVSSIDSLTRTGAYDDVPFHRVVRNFVIQGGDIDRKDGFGGPEYRLPTEPSFKSFERGMVGIASSGQDTEGSQYFVMQNWSPHLDGNYTIFGKVTKGMDVADRLQLGDRVLKAEIYSR